MKTELKERPILFSGSMVRAIEDNRKTQTRRVVTPQPIGEVSRKANFDGLFSDTQDPVSRYFNCPYGQPGDRLWVRETWAAFDDQAIEEHDLERVFYRADGPDRDDDGSWKPSIHMPRWASRITLEIVNVHVERLQDISEADAMAEGVEPQERGFWKAYNCKEGFTTTAKRSFETLWNSINAKRGFGWDRNPWVWVIEFKRM